MSEYKSYFFIGHREADERLLPRLELVIDRLIRDEDVRYFYVGGHGGFDRIAAAAVKRAKQKYPDITLMLVLPYHPAECPVDAPDGFDGTYYPDGLENTPRRYAIVRTNHIMVNVCDWLCWACMTPYLGMSTLMLWLMRDGTRMCIKAAKS